MLAVALKMAVVFFALFLLLMAFQEEVDHYYKKWGVDRWNKTLF